MYLNALYFEGKWVKEFDPKLTEKKPFESPTGKVTTPTMHMPEGTLSACFDSTQPGVRLPFLGNRYSLIAIVPPDRDSLKSLIANMTGTWFAEYQSNLSPTELIIDLPTLDLSTCLSLNSAIEKLGGGALFAPGLDLSTLVPTQSADKDNFFISSVIQQAKLKLGEKGVKAAAVTEIGTAAGSAPGSHPREPQRISFDKPFVFFIVHNPSRAIVLCGIVNDPSKS
jgi:serine protease inhibitor